MVRLSQNDRAIDQPRRGNTHAREVRASKAEWALVILVLANLWWTTLCLGGHRPENDGGHCALNLATLGLWWTLGAWKRSRLGCMERRLADPPDFWRMEDQRQRGSRWCHGWAGGIGSWPCADGGVFWVVIMESEPGAQVALFAGVAALGVVVVGMAAYQDWAIQGWLMTGRRQSRSLSGGRADPSASPTAWPRSSICCCRPCSC